MHQPPALPREVAGIRIPDGRLPQKASTWPFACRPTLFDPRDENLRLRSLAGKAQNLHYERGALLSRCGAPRSRLTPEFGHPALRGAGADAADRS